MEQMLRDLLARHGRLSVPVERLGLNDDLHEAGLTSLATVDVMLAIEAEFDIEIPDRLLNRQSFGSLSRLLDMVAGCKAHA